MLVGVGENWGEVQERLSYEWDALRQEGLLRVLGAWRHGYERRAGRAAEERATGVRTWLFDVGPGQEAVSTEVPAYFCGSNNKN